MAGVRFRWLWLALVLLIARPGPASAQPPINLGAEWQHERLVSWAEFEVAATPEQAFSVLTDYARQAEFLPGVLSSTVSSRDGARVQIEQELEASVLMFRQRMHIRMEVVETPPRQLTLKLLAGSFRSWDGSYELLPMAEGARTRIAYQATFEPDFDLPRMMGPYVVKRSLEKNLRAFIAEVERRTAVAHRAVAATDRL